MKNILIAMKSLTEGLSNSFVSSRAVRTTQDTERIVDKEARKQRITMECFDISIIILDQSRDVNWDKCYT